MYHPAPWRRGCAERARCSREPSRRLTPRGYAPPHGQSPRGPHPAIRSRSSNATPREGRIAVDDPQRIVDDPEAPPLARSLLASAEGDAPSARNRAAVAKRLGIAAALIAGGSELGAGATASAAASAAWW